MRLRSLVAIELKVEDFRPEFAGKMNFYLSAIDDQLRHPDDNPSIGIILCQGRNETVVEYALRDTRKPMGVARYTMSTALPHELQRELPTLEELANDFPALPVVKLRMEIEQALRERMKPLTTAASPSDGIVSMVRSLDDQGLAPPSSDRFLQALGVLNQIAHGVEVESDLIERAVKTGKQFLSELNHTLPDDK